ncbi:hypothetical protein PISS_a2662 [Pseudoalteromonas issachenkonii]|uniref:Uncharacterized protein n=1 Tax=Pseudoalteromonas issachenkonii TaxID=152297 RepID=A0ABN5C5Y7_9GAMM|nr:hypothetical protein PISS_a2662 [Pseudoalteromonas issachenkonii]
MAWLRHLFDLRQKVGWLSRRRYPTKLWVHARSSAASAELS